MPARVERATRAAVPVGPAGSHRQHKDRPLQASLYRDGRYPAGPKGPAVCHITTVHQPFDTRIFHKECVSLARAGYDVHLVACHDRDEVVDGVRIHALPRPPGRLRRMLCWPWRAVAVARGIRPRPAVYHIHDPELLPAAQALRLGGERVIFDVHENIAADILYKPYWSPGVRRAVSWAYRQAERLLTAGLPTVHVLAEIARTYCGRRVVVRNLPLRRQIDESTAEAAGPPPHRHRLVYLGVVSTERGAGTMLEVMRRLLGRGVDCELVVVGPVHEAHLAERLTDEAASDDLAGRVILRGALPYPAAMAEVKAADLGLCLFHPVPNNLTSLPNKLLEYLSMGTAVVASDFECWRPYVRGTGGGIQVDPLDPVQIADGIEDLLRRPRQVRRMGELGRAAVRERLCWEVEQEKLLALYRSLAGPP